MIGRIAWLLLCGALAVVAVFMELDRQSRRDLYLADNVPAAFRGFAQHQLAVEAVNAGHADALEVAGELVRRRPIPSEHLALLGLAALQADRPALGEQAILQSAQRGWRVPIAQQAVALAAVQNGNPLVAADRLIALWQSGAKPELLKQTTGPVLADRKARAAFADSIAGYPLSQHRFLRWAPDNLDPLVFAATVANAARAGTVFDCADLALAADRIARSGNVEPATRIWQGECPAGAAPDALGFGSEPADGPSGPFDWNFPDQAGLSLSWRNSASGWVIDYRNREPFRVLMAERIAALPPGNHSLSVISDRSRGKATAAPELNVWCLRADGKKQRLARAASTVALQIPVTDCTVQMIQLEVPAGEAEGVRIVSR